jgi:regulator of sirC expression with transglutaminase-like and TPR domain
MTFPDALRLLAADPDAPIDPAEVALLLAADEYPDLDIGAQLTRLDHLAAEVAPRLAGDLAARAAALADFLFEEKGFRGNTADYYDPRNSYLNDVLDRGLGIPITLSVLAMAVGARAGLTVVGVGVPGHFVAKAVAGDEEMLFDPFHEGRSLTPEGCADLAKAVTGRSFAPTPAALQPAPLGAIVARMLNNLKGIYLQREDYARAARVIERLRVLTPDDLVQRRDLGVALVRAERPGAAVAHLEAYLGQSPPPEDAKLVEKVLRRAKQEVARWN